MPTAFTGDFAYDNEVNLWVTSASEEMAREVKGSKFRLGFLQRKNKTRTIYNHFGKPIAQVRCSDLGHSEHEFDNHQDAVVRPEPVTTLLR